MNWAKFLLTKTEPVENLTTWVYEQGSFVPIAKIVDDECYSIINDYIGRPIQAYNKNGEKVWEAEYDIYGGLKNLKGDRNFIPFRQLGQYEDIETGLYYNRFRYYDCNTGTYISKDPISILGGLNVYAYVSDINKYVDVFGLECSKRAAFRQAKRDADIPMSQVPYDIQKVPMTDKFDRKILDANNKPIMTTEYHYINNKGQQIVIQNHSAGHYFLGGIGDQPPHFNVRPIENTRTGFVPGTKSHYPFKN